MFSKLFKIGSWFTAEVQVVYHDVEAIISDFTKTVTKLEAAAEAKVKEADAHLAAAQKYEQLSDAAADAAEKATRVARQIKALVA